MAQVNPHDGWDDVWDNINMFGEPIRTVRVHKNPCCPGCISGYLTEALGYPVCCHLQLSEEYNNDDYL